MENECPKTAEDAQKSYKFNLEASHSKDGNSLRNEDSLFSTKKKKKKLVKSKFEDKKVNIGLSRKSNSENKYNQIVININNQINTVQNNTKVQNQDNHNLNLVVNKDSNSNPTMQQNGPIKTAPQEFVEIKLNPNSNHETTFKYNDKVLEASQNLIIVNMTRLLFSKKCSIVYFVLLFICLSIFIVTLLDVTLNLNLMNSIWLFVIEVLVFAIILADASCRFFALKPEYLSNYLLMTFDGLVLVFFVVQLVRFICNLDNSAFLIINSIYCVITTLRFVIVYFNLKSSLRRQADVRQNIEEIINFTDVLDDNHKNFDNKIQKRFTPAISFVDENTGKKRELSLVKNENPDGVKIDGEKEITQ